MRSLTSRRVAVAGFALSAVLGLAGCTASAPARFERRRGRVDRRRRRGAADRPVVRRPADQDRARGGLRRQLVAQDHPGRADRRTVGMPQRDAGLHPDRRRPAEVHHRDQLLHRPGLRRDRHLRRLRQPGAQCPEERPRRRRRGRALHRRPGRAGRHRLRRLRPVRLRHRGRHDGQVAARAGRARAPRCSSAAACRAAAPPPSRSGTGSGRPPTNSAARSPR